MQREGSPWSGLGAVLGKELADHLGSARMRVLEWLIILTAAASLYGVFQAIREATPSDDFIFLRLFTMAQSPMPSFSALLVFILPLIAIGLGFDAVNAEYNRRTMSRLLSQPIYRDALLAGKFLAALATIAISLLALWLLIVGAGILLMGIPPNGEEVARSLLFLLLALSYAGVWLAVALLCSICFRSATTSALVCLALWLFLTLLWPMLVPALAHALASPDAVSALLGQPSADALQWQQALGRVSPAHLFEEGILALLSPETRTLGPVFITQLSGAVLGRPLPLAESVAIVWPQAVTLIAGVIVLFTAGYSVFLRQEVRA